MLYLLIKNYHFNYLTRKSAYLKETLTISHKTHTLINAKKYKLY